MIRYALRCTQDHRFESWFQSADAFDALRARGMLSCAICGATDVEKSIMAPQLATSDTHKAPTAKPQSGALSQPANPAEQALRALRDKVETNAEDVGGNFAKEARKIHDGDAPERAIFGQAKLEDAKSLIDDGISVLPLPFRPTRRSN